MDIVSKKLAEQLNVEDEINGPEKTQASEVNPLTTQQTYSSSLVTQADIDAFKSVQSDLGLEDFSKIVLMKTAQKAMNDHDELIDTMAKVDDSKAARMAEVAISALSTASDAAKSLMNFTMAKEKLEIEKTKLEIKSVTINNVGTEGGAMMGGTQKEVMDQIKSMMENEADGTDDPPPLIEIN